MVINSQTKESEIPLVDVIKKHPEFYLGTKLKFQENRPLPFLMKVLSVNQALSIQAHPDKKLAEKLFAQGTYPDDNHKPEVAVSLSDFEGLCGFRDPIEIINWTETLPEFAKVLGQDNIDALKAAVDTKEKSKISAALKQAYAQLFQESCEKAKALRDAAIDAAIARKEETPEFGLIERLQEKYPYDVGCLAPFFLNYVRMGPGKCLFMAENVPHALKKNLDEIFG